MRRLREVRLSRGRLLTMPPRAGGRGGRRRSGCQERVRTGELVAGKVLGSRPKPRILDCERLQPAYPRFVSVALGASEIARLACAELSSISQRQKLHSQVLIRTCMPRNIASQ